MKDLPIVPPVHGRRQIHLDFHNSADVGELAGDFDAVAFASTLQKAAVSSVNVFAKCHHGYSYYPTAVGTMHPGLQRDLLGEQIAALHQRGIAASIYVSVLWDDLAGERNPDWVVVDRRGSRVARGPLANSSPLENERGWTTLDVGGDYGTYVIDQLREILHRYPVDGFWLDIVWAEPNYSPAALRRIVAAGVDPEDEGEMREHAERVLQSWMARVQSTVNELAPQATLFFNGTVDARAHDRLPLQTHLEVESLPTSGDVWGYMHFPTTAKYVQPLGAPMLGMTGRFHRSWADFGGLKTPAQLDYECGTILAAGGGVSIGDQLDPSGRLDDAVYRVIGEAFTRVGEVEPVLDDLSRVGEVAVVASRRSEFAGMHTSAVFSPSVEGAVQMLLDLHMQFSIVDEADAELSTYPLIIVPSGHHLTAAGRRNVDEALERGSRVIVEGDALRDASAASGRLLTLPVVEVEPTRTNPSYVVPGELGGEDGAVDRDYAYALYGSALRVTPNPGARSFGRVHPARFTRTWRTFTSHAHAPVDASDGSPFAVAQGRVLYLAAPLFSLYRAENYWVYRALFSNLLDAFGVRPIVMCSTSHVEVTVHRSADHRRLVLHLVPYTARRAFASVPRVDDGVALADVAITLRLPSAGDVRASLVPAGDRVDVSLGRDEVRLELPVVRGYTVILLDVDENETAQGG